MNNHVADLDVTAWGDFMAPHAQKERMKEILIVDDNVTSLKQIGAYLTGKYNFSMAKSGAQALQICARERPDLILLDVEMPEMDGFATLEKIKQTPVLSRIPVIFLSGNRDIPTEVKCLHLGALDFIKKPIEKNILIHRLELHLKISSYQIQLADSVARMADSISTTIAEMIEWRDENTGGHVLRTSKLVELIGRELLLTGQFDSELSPSALEMIVRAAPLHDIGKISISDTILLKPDKLNDEEFKIMKTHAALGAEILRSMHARMLTQSYLMYAEKIAASHHERYDGNGYPYGLSGDDIPLCARIMAVADVYDALVNSRIYRKSISHDEAFSMIMDGRGTQFDPRIVDAFETALLNSRWNTQKGGFMS
ncbi:two-component system response regulator [Synergistales bacterium]|nr:two-component system response regulator [Synergistales bacterium]